MAGNNPLGEKDVRGNLIQRNMDVWGSYDKMASVTKRYEGKVALCMACSIGIGYSIARRLAQEGAHVLICSRKQEQVDIAVKQLQNEGFKATGMACNVEEDADRAKVTDHVAKTFGKCDVLILNQATTGGASSLIKGSNRDQWAKVFRCNLESRWLHIRELKEAGLLQRGSAVCVTNGGGAYA